MSFSSTGLLQFDDLKELLASYAGSLAGRELLLALEPHSERERLEADLAEAGEAIRYLRDVAGAQETKGGTAVRLRFDQLRDVEGAVRILQVEGASLEGREILDLFHNLVIAGRVSRHAAGCFGALPQAVAPRLSTGGLTLRRSPLCPRLSSGRQSGR